jgi:ABC-type ATPase with predicted acetyltransferase domain
VLVAGADHHCGHCSSGVDSGSVDQLETKECFYRRVLEMTKYYVDVRFNTEVERSERVLEIAEAFGIGLDDKEFVVFDKQEFEIEQGDVVYITGQSGSGKSIVLRELSKQMTKSGLNVANIDHIELLSKPLIDQIGKDNIDGQRLMSIAGISDAFLWCRKPEELSDGQRYRFRLAKIIESGAKVWIADEFLAVLDRTTAKVLAMNLQKVARIVGATLMVATTHTDMVEDLAPNLYIEKRYREKIKIIKAPEGYKTCN